MRLILKFFSFVIIFTFVFIIFLPKEQLFNKVVNIAYENKVYLKDYTFNEDLIRSDIKDMNIIYDGINIVNIKNISIQALLIQNNINISNIEIDASLNSFVPSEIQNININYTIFNPLILKANINSKLYSVKIDFDILSMQINAVFKTSKFFRTKYKKLIKELKYDKNIKDYTYEYKL